ncbi:NAD(P)/FAD-dependent oxidoreductase [Desulfallas thermosapovorans]|uniref:Pyridine nucleotide-disulfide oxidoreductase n=1 Tax=Desulfallas thermosapovorans DSM 6562 TaxID=1121431 RepID=A0A5S4ZNP1_9FIRM|nr:FAD-dependent oxidoreductase [Desulfallas thermosapovorans]TYO93883.1 pyridine nucleotide-disulfide oxidoreductase [Desulfallas thermosapovorans DSM 6562]
MKYVIIGGSAAGLTAAETLRANDSEASITIVTDEPESGYARCLIPDVLAGAKELAGITWRAPGFGRKNNFSIIKDTRVVSLEPAQRQVLLHDGRAIGYDRLLVATGAVPVAPTGSGTGVEGIFTLRTYRQARAIGEAADKGKQAVVVGGGLVGLKAAVALRKRGVQRVTLLVESPHLLVRQLDEESAAMLERELNNQGINCIFGARPAEYVKNPGKGSLRSIILVDGSEIPADLVVVGKGVLPNITLVRNAGGMVGKGIKVDEHMQTTLPGVFAAGDCIEVNDLLTGRPVPSGLWPLAVEQGRCAAFNMLGKPRVYPPPVTRLNATQFGGLPLVSVGQVRIDGKAAEYTVHVSRTLHYYRKLVFKQDRLVGFIMLGNIDRAGVYTALVKKGIPVSQTLKQKLQDGTVCVWDLLTS